MTISERFENIKFTKSVAGYTQKEVDGFIADVLPLIREEEQLIAALRVKLAAFEGKSEEIREQEQKAYRLLEAAKEEAEIIVATAKKNAKDIESEARVAAEVQQRAAGARAAETIADANAKADARVSEANAAAERIIATADARGRELLAKVKAVCDEEERKAKALANECVAFENRFRTIVADTAVALAKMKEETPVPYDEVAKVPEVKNEDAPKPLEKEEATSETTVEIPVAISHPKREEPHIRRLYDTVNVTYENEEDDFSEIKGIMSGKDLKSPTSFSE